MDKQVAVNSFSLMTPLAKDNFGWSNGDTILYLSILMAAGGTIAILWDEFCPIQDIICPTNLKD